MTTPTEPEALAAAYLIRKNGLYYRPKAQGYTGSRAAAGRFTLEQAISYSHPNGPDGPRDGITYEPAPTPAARMLAGEGEAVDPLRAALAEGFCVSNSAGHRDPAERSYRLIFQFSNLTALQSAHRIYIEGGSMPASPPAAEPVGLRDIDCTGVTPELMNGKASMKALAGILQRGAESQKPRSKQIARGELNAEADARFILDCIKIALSPAPDRGEGVRAAKCFHCAAPYDETWVEAVIPHDLWAEKFSPTANGGGLLCISCMSKRAVSLGLHDIPTEISAGPFVMKSAPVAESKT